MNVLYLNARSANAGDNVAEEEGEPADDENPHHRPQRFGRLGLLGKPRDLLAGRTVRRGAVRGAAGGASSSSSATVDAQRDFALAAPAHR